MDKWYAEPTAEQLADLEQLLPDLLDVDLEEIKTGLNPDDPIVMYLKELERFGIVGLPTLEEEQRLVAAYAKDDEEFQRTLIEAFLPLVVKLAWPYRDRVLSFLDLIQEGNLGLIRAISYYEPQSNFRLLTYVAWWIRNYILAVFTFDWVTLEESRLNLSKELGRAPTLDELAAKMNLFPSQLSSLATLSSASKPPEWWYEELAWQSGIPRESIRSIDPDVLQKLRGDPPKGRVKKFMK